MNDALTPRGIEPRPAREVVGAAAIVAGHAGILADESRLTAAGVERLHLPTDAAEVAGALLAAAGRGARVTISGARTGITGGAAPLESGEVVSLAGLTPRPVVRRDGEGWRVRVGAGTTLDGLAAALAGGDCEHPDGRPPVAHYYPVDATEGTAQLGGTIATNASGARTYRYGPTRDQVRWVQVVLADGRLLELERGTVRAVDGRLRLIAADGSAVDLPLADLPAPATKHNAGYALRRDMDAVDLFVGSEGTLGVITAAELRLWPVPPERLYMTQFAGDDDTVVAWVEAVGAHPDLAPLALEYLGPRALELVRRRGSASSAHIELSRLPATAGSLLYAEVPFASEDELDRIHAGLAACAAAAGLDPTDSWAGFTVRDLEEMKRLRHALPETVNAIVGERRRSEPRLHKVGTDLAVPATTLGEMLAIYREHLSAAGLQYVIFGHIGDAHLHANLLPRDAAELDRATGLYAKLARAAVDLGGSIAGEHGIGRLKRHLLPIQFSAADLAAMRAVKNLLDPTGLLNPGVLFASQGDRMDPAIADGDRGGEGTGL